MTIKFLSLALNTNHYFCYSSYFDDVHVHIILIFKQICVHDIKNNWSLLLCSIDIEVGILYLVEIEVDIMSRLI